MSSIGSLVDAFERVMAAVAFAERDDRDTACWILKPDSADASLWSEESIRAPRARQPELRM